ncbi:DUF3592 domain-containing protein [Bifidobacterium vespertilionis]|uniref:DUF3592 domain-containing protein n=1 Tax=Bifidobacterium vespertilionis TaxID=2562524 RepID=UPI001BDBC971|nr:DUF3592 domain-containing protein [Bifidobacterium vespertilionis]MBT1179566.1 DUF3592 domain-containing protein [Bifidobacterium vespertilionis]
MSSYESELTIASAGNGDSGISPSTILRLFFVVGLFILLGSGYAGYQYWHLSQVCTQPSSARIVDVRYEPAVDEDDSDTWIATIQYTADGDLEYTKPGAVSTSTEGKYQVGDEIAIRYNPSNPSEYVIVGNSWVSLVIIGSILGIVFVLPHSIALIVRFRRRRAAVRLAAQREENLRAAQSPWDSSQETTRD